MAEGGIAASMGNANAKDNWQVHFRDTMRGGKFLNNPRMAELHAKEAPHAGLGAGDLRRAVRPHPRRPDQPAQLRRPRVPPARPRRRPHRPRADPHPAAEDRLACSRRTTREHRRPRRRLRVFAELTVTDLLKDGDAVGRAPSATGASPAGSCVFEAPAVILATGGIGKSFKVTTNSWEYTGDGHALALRAGATLINMEFIQFHPTGMVWPPSVKGILVTESVRGDGGVLRNSEGKRFMFDYVPDVFRGQYADTEEEADRWYKDPENNKRPPELLPRDEVARAINTEVKEGRGSPHGGVFLDVSTRLPAEEIIRRLPSMHHQFKELADVDITAEPMEVGPTCHYVMGGVEVDADTAATTRARAVRGRRGRRRHARVEPARRQLASPTCWSSAAGPAPARRHTSRRWASAPGDHATRTSTRRRETAARPARFRGRRRENPYTLPPGAAADDERPGRHHPPRGRDRARRSSGSTSSSERADRVGVEGHRQFNPGWHLALDLRNMLAVCRVRRDGGAGAHREPRRPHPRGPPGDGPAVARGQPGLPLDGAGRRRS